MDQVTVLRFNLRESEDSSYFEEEELHHLLDKYKGDVNKASYEGLIIKSEDDSIALPGGLKVPSNRNYWLTLARRYRTNFTSSLVRGDDIVTSK